MLNEDYEVELLKKLPKYHRRIYDFQQIAGAQTPELQFLLQAIDFVLDSWFITTATEYGISRQEKIAGIIPNPSDTLETRRFRLLTQMTDKIPYTDITLEEKLDSLCGKGNYSIVRDYVNYKISIDTSLGVVGAFDEVCNALLKLLPCNLVLEVTNTLKEQKLTLTYIGVVTSTAMRYLVTNDINCGYLGNISMYYGLGVSKADTHIITHDTDIKNALELTVKGAVGVGTAHTRIITHDISGKANTGGNATVVNPINTATVITIN